MVRRDGTQRWFVKLSERHHAKASGLDNVGVNNWFRRYRRELFGSLSGNQYRLENRETLARTCGRTCLCRLARC